MSQASKPRNAKPGQKGSPKKSSLAALVLGNRKVKSNETKQAEEKRRKAAKERRASKDVASYIGYDAVYKDGIAQVEEGLFSQTIEFSDVSYQSARKETQENIFTVLSGLYNYFGADTSVELTIANTPIPHDEIGNKRFFEHSSEKTRPIVDEYNRILNDKMREGVSNLERHRYITYMVGADDVDEAVPKLARIRADVSTTLSRIRCNSSALDGTERLRVIDSIIRPSKRFEFSWDKMSQY